MNLTRRNGRDSVHGGPGNDEFGVETDDLPDLIDCGAGRDTVLYNGLNGIDELDQLTDCEVVGIF